MTFPVDAAEIGAVKTEIVQAMRRRLSGDRRLPSDLFGVGITAIGECVADMMFAAARDEAHAERLLHILNAIVRSRWNQLAKSSTG